MVFERGPKLVLASGSPQRRRLLEEAGYEFGIIVPGPQAESGASAGETAIEHVARLARQKAADVAGRADGPGGHKSCLIVACDTIAECAGQFLGKPRDKDHARQILRLLRGREHRVHSGLCLWPCPAGEPQVRVDTTTLLMDNLRDDQIEEYLASGLWQGKAGAFGYQDRAGWLTIVSGSESNVIGLPMELLAEMLGEVAQD
jgi:septum formation protein